MACGILAPRPGCQPTPCIECAVPLTAGPPGKSQGEGFKGRILVNTSILRHCRKMGNGNHLQCSCLENPRDGGAWWAAISGVAQGWTWLKRLSSSSNSIYIESKTYPILQMIKLKFSDLELLISGNGSTWAQAAWLQKPVSLHYTTMPLYVPLAMV